MKQKPVKLKTTIPEFDALHEQVDNARTGTIEIKICRRHLNNIVDDNEMMLSLLPIDDHTGRPIPEALYRDQKRAISSLRAAMGSTPRKNSKFVSIDKKYIMSTLIGHSILIGILEDSGEEIG